MGVEPISPSVKSGRLRPPLRGLGPCEEPRSLGKYPGVCYSFANVTVADPQVRAVFAKVCSLIPNSRFNPVGGPNPAPPKAP